MKTILVVDDVRDLADSTAELFRLMGYETRTAYNGQEAMDAVAERLPDVVLLDLHMPGVDGFEAAKRIRNCHAGHPPVLIAVSAIAGPAIADKLRACGFDHYVTKPADVLALTTLFN